MKPANEERRQHPRLALEWPAAIKRAGQPASIPGKTVNVSCGGLYCLAEEAFRPGERLELVLLLPQDMDPRGRPVRLECRVSVVRVEPAAEGYGLACRILDYDLVVGVNGKAAQLEPQPAWAVAG